MKAQLKLMALGAAAITAVLLFQNCGDTGFRSGGPEARTDAVKTSGWVSGNGDVYEGKPYFQIDAAACPAGDHHKGVIVVSSGGALMTVENCQELSPPKALLANSYVINSADELIHQGEVYLPTPTSPTPTGVGSDPATQDALPSGLASIRVTTYCSADYDPYPLENTDLAPVIYFSIREEGHSQPLCAWQEIIGVNGSVRMEIAASRTISFGTLVARCPNLQPGRVYRLAMGGQFSYFNVLVSLGETLRLNTALANPFESASVSVLVSSGSAWGCDNLAPGS